MRLPNRKPGKYTFKKIDFKITQTKLALLKKQLANLTTQLPIVIKETQCLAENGDFSENAEYQIAKGKLRKINQAIAELKYQINHAVIINSPTNNQTIQIGHTVVLETNGVKKTFQILSSNEANPMAGIISYQSPLGSILLGKSLGETIELKLAKKTIRYKIIAVY